MSLSNWDAWCWIIGVFGLVVLMTILIVRKRYRVFPWFTGLLLVEIIQTAALFLAHRYGGERIYFSTYWLGEIIEAFVRVGVLFELARITARHLGEVERRRVRPMAYSLLCAAVACVYVILREHGLNNPIVTLAVKVSLCTSILGGFLALTIFLVTFYEGIRLRIHSQAVTYGMVVYLSGRLVGELALLLRVQNWWLSVQNGLKPIYILCLFVWSVVFWFDEPTQVLNDEMNRFHQAFIRLDPLSRGQTATKL